MTRSILLLVAVLALAACGAETRPDDASADAPPVAGTPQPMTVVVSIENSRFSMPDLDLRIGDTIRFEQLDPYAHTVTQVSAQTGAGDEPTFDSGELRQGASFEITFDRAGTYEYFCRIHPTMRGTVDVS